MTTDTPIAPSDTRRDWLLTSARLLVTIIMVIVAAVTAILAAAAIAVPLLQDQVLIKISEHMVRNPGTEVVVGISALFALVVVMGLLAFQWLRELRRIIDSVSLGDPFAPQNALRLARMGWLTVGIEAMSIPAGAVAGFLTHIVRRAQIDVGLSLGGVLMALLLFILARVFREGAAMREELEGTV